MPESAGDLANEIFRPHAALLDPEVKEIALPGRLVSGDFLDLEVFGFLLDAAADAGQIGGQERRRGEGVEDHRSAVGLHSNSITNFGPSSTMWKRFST